MKSARFHLLAICAVFLPCAVACSSSDSTKPTGAGEVATIAVQLAEVSAWQNEYEEVSDTVRVKAVVLDARGNSIDTQQVDWRLEQPNGSSVGDSIASITSTGPQTGAVLFRREATVGIVASVAGASGMGRSGILYLSWSR